MSMLQLYLLCAVIYGANDKLAGCVAFSVMAAIALIGGAI